MLNSPADDPLKEVSANVLVALNYIYNDGGRLDAQIESLNSQIKLKKKLIIIKIKTTQLEVIISELFNALRNKRRIS